MPLSEYMRATSMGSSSAMGEALSTNCSTCAICRATRGQPNGGGEADPPLATSAPRPLSKGGGWVSVVYGGYQARCNTVTTYFNPLLEMLQTARWERRGASEKPSSYIQGGGGWGGYIQPLCCEWCARHAGWPRGGERLSGCGRPARRESCLEGNDSPRGQRACSGVKSCMGGPAAFSSCALIAEALAERSSSCAKFCRPHRRRAQNTGQGQGTRDRGNCTRRPCHTDMAA